ncbi:type II secretion system protein J [Bordetella genomosp. 13]|uniref:PulJ/GspJ family protein n=1 Tax=Bordetella genomosp. 13 TaxID=463040 RepID=UPI001C930FEE|nr:prepilin-type N-terminal cleavage/methylation domain-containing protein [Bordetella genomosp. 13]
MHDSHRFHRPQRGAHAQAGFTLIEILVAVVLMAFVSLIAWRALDSVTRASTHLDRSTEATLSTLRALEQFERDIALRATVELPLSPEDGNRPQLDEDGLPLRKRLLPESLTTERGRVPFRIEIVRALPDANGMLQRVYWWIERGTLYRSAAPASDHFPLPAPDARNAVAVLQDVQDFEVRAWRPGAGWTRLPYTAESKQSSGLEVLIAQRTDRGDERYRRVIALR